MDSDQASTNPFAAPTADIAFKPDESDWTKDEAIRHEYLKREQSVKAIGAIFVILSLIVGVVCIGLAGALISSFQGAGSRRGLAVSIVTLAVLGCLVTGQVAIGIGIRRLQSWSRIPAIVISALWMFYVPVGTVLNIIFLVALIGKKNRFVFTPEYSRIIVATPHVKYRSSTLLWVALIVFVAVLIAIGVSALSSL